MNGPEQWTGADAASLRSVRFRQQREQGWKELEALLQRIEGRGLASLSPAEVARLPVLYRATVSALSVARATSLDKNLLEYLEALGSRAYYVVYGPRLRFVAAMVEFVFQTFPSTVRRCGRHVCLAGIFMLIGAIIGAVYAAKSPAYYYAIVGPMAQDRTPAATTESLRDTLYDDGGGRTDRLAEFSAQLFTHNSQVGLLSFAFGFLAGIPVFYLMFYNGAVLGAFASLFHSRGLSLDLWGWLLPHGITELFAIVLCGGAGLMLADGLIFPGTRARREHLSAMSRDAGLVVIGAILMLAVAGGIEGIFRQTVTSIEVRYGVATLSLAGWAAYIGWGGRRSREAI